MEENIILHLGLGAFHRAHQAVYLDDLHQQGDQSWVLVSGNLRTHPTLKNLFKAKGQYTLETINPKGEKKYRLIQAITKVIDDNVPENLLEVGKDVRTKIISFTVTEAGYYLDVANKLELAPDIRNDLNAIKEGKMGTTVYGGIYCILKERIALQNNSSHQITLMSCDNLRHNGDRFKTGMEQFLKYTENKELIDWFNENCTCPNGMVDRITPRPTSEVIDRVKQTVGKLDVNSIMGEEFIQWVLEDRFIAGRPQWERVGVEIVKDVSSYEEAKIRILNASHSCIAWAGALIGYNFIHEGALDPVVRSMVYNYITYDVMPVLEPSPVDLKKYRDVVLDRFSNSYLKDTNQRVAMDGFSKIPGFIAPTIRDCLKQGLPINSVIMLPALFLRFLIYWREGKINFEYEDQVMKITEVKRIVNATDPVVSFCENFTLWGDLANNEDLVKEMYVGMEKVNDFILSYSS